MKAIYIIYVLLIDEGLEMFFKTFGERFAFTLISCDSIRK